MLHVTNCSTGYKTGQKKASLHFHEDLPLSQSYVSIILKKNL